MSAAPIVGFAGMTHLGIVSSVAAAAMLFETICFDDDPDLISDLRHRKSPIYEPGLDDLLASNGELQIFTTAISDLARCNVVYISVDVATNELGDSDLDPARKLISKVSGILRADATLVVLSQIPPGFMRSLQYIPMRLFYQVETLIFGEAVTRARSPERIIVGCRDPLLPLPDGYSYLLNSFRCTVIQMRYESAELAKIAINCCLVATISVANTLAEICERVGADWNEIVPPLKMDRRIGSYAYLKPGLGIAGGNLERDLRTIVKLAERHGTDSGVVLAWIANSRHRSKWVVDILHAKLGKSLRDARLAVWGLTYKENTRSVKNSPSIATIEALQDSIFKLHDPEVLVDVVRHRRAVNVSTPLAALESCDALLILTPWADYRAISPADIRNQMQGRLIVDPYGVIDHTAATSLGLDHVVLGAGSI